MSSPTQHSVSVAGSPVHVVEQGAGPTVVLLHGARFSSRTWLELGTIEAVSIAGFHALAPDLPGFGETPASPLEAEDFLASLLDALAVEAAVVVTPSMSGRFALPFAARNSARVAGLVAVAPVGIDRWASEFATSAIPLLTVWSTTDPVVSPELAETLAAHFDDASHVRYKDAPHPCYLEHSQDFAREILEFARRAFD